MTIRLSKDQEQFVHDAVQSGLYAREDDVIRDALTRLQQTIPPATKSSARQAKSTRQAKAKEKPITLDELHRRMLADGLLSQLPDDAQDIDDDQEDEPVVIEGEPLSETIIRERR
jgi:Arc/MetJ-type ribon-helix-helix transcriptional regulator